MVRPVEPHARSAVSSRTRRSLPGSDHRRLRHRPEGTRVAVRRVMRITVVVFGAAVVLAATSAWAEPPAKSGLSLGIGGGGVRDVSPNEHGEGFLGTAHLGYRFGFGLEPTILLLYGEHGGGLGIGARYGVTFDGFRPYVEAGVFRGTEDAPVFPELGAGLERRLI